MENELVELLMIKGNDGKPSTSSSNNNHGKKKKSTKKPKEQEKGNDDNDNDEEEQYIIEPTSKPAVFTGEDYKPPVTVTQQPSSSSSSVHASAASTSSSATPQATLSSSPLLSSSTAAVAKPPKESLQARLENMGAAEKLEFHHELGPPLLPEYKGFTNAKDNTERHRREFQQKADIVSNAKAIEWDPFFGPPVRKGAKGSTRPEAGSKPKRPDAPKALPVAATTNPYAQFQQQQQQQQQVPPQMMTETMNGMQQQQMSQQQLGAAPPPSAIPYQQQPVQPGQQPAQQQQFPPQVLEFAKYITIDIGKEQELLPLAAQCLNTPLPPIWRPVRDPHSGRTYFVNMETQQTTWDHPMKVEFVKKVEVERQKLAAMKEVKEKQQEEEEVKEMKQEENGTKEDEMKSTTTAAVAGKTNPILNKLKRATNAIKTQKFMKTEAENSQFAHAASSALFTQMKERQSGVFEMTSDEDADDNNNIGKKKNNNNGVVDDIDIDDILKKEDSLGVEGREMKSVSNSKPTEKVNEDIQTSGFIAGPSAISLSPSTSAGRYSSAKQNDNNMNNNDKNSDFCSSSDESSEKEDDKESIDSDFGIPLRSSKNSSSSSKTHQKKQEQKLQQHSQLKNRLMEDLGELSVPSHKPKKSSIKSKAKDVALIDTSSEDEDEGVCVAAGGNGTGGSYHRMRAANTISVGMVGDFDL